MDIDALVAPLSDDQPSGPDLYGDLKRQQIEQVFDRSISDGTASENSASQWQDAIDLIVEQCEVTRDLWLPVYLMRAAAHAGQFDLVVEAATFLARLIDSRWQDVHPQLEDLGFIGRKTPCESLTRIGDFLGPLDRMPLVVHPRMGPISAADFEKFRASGPKAGGFGEFRQAIEAIGEAGLQQAVDGIEALSVAIKSVDGTLTANADGDTATNIQPTYDLLSKMKKAVVSFMPKAVNVPIGSEDNSASDGGEIMGPNSSASGPAFSGGINSRDDVFRAIDAISAYYARSEPSSPVPFVLRRARDWISLDFMAVLEDIAPGSLDEAGRVLKGRDATTQSYEDRGNIQTNQNEEPEESAVSDGGGWN